jgi:hypothetical protein
MSYGEAIDAALAWLKVSGVSHLDEAFEARSGAFGMRTLDGGSGYRLEFDSRVGAHINIWHHHTKGPHFIFPGNEGDVKAKWRQLFLWDNIKWRSELDSEV